MARAYASEAQPSRLRAARSSARGNPAAVSRHASAAARVRWDRLARLAMLFVLGALLYLYLSAGMRMLSTWSQAHRGGAAVAAMTREHALLLRQHELLGRQGTLEAEARRLGMTKRNEQPYIVSGLPNN
jgi:hypothetical protein